MLTQNDIDSLFGKFIDENIRLEQKDVEASAKSREWFLERLKSEISKDESNPKLYVADPFVKFGSYFAGTQVKPVDEKDVLVVIDSNTGVFSRSGSSYGKGLGSANPNKKYNSKYMKDDGTGVSPTKQLNWLKKLADNILIPLGGEASFRNGQSVTIKLKSKNLKIDLIPAGIFSRTIDSNNIFYNIPNGKADNGWIITNPKIDLIRLKNLAQSKNGIKDIVRLLKFIRDSYKMNISSYAIQCSVCDFAEDNYWSENFSYNFEWALKSFIRDLKLGTIYDGYNPNLNLLDGVESLGYYAGRLENVESVLSSLQQEDSRDSAYKKMVNILSNGKVEVKLSEASFSLKERTLKQLFDNYNNF